MFAEFVQGGSDVDGDAVGLVGGVEKMRSPLVPLMNPLPFGISVGVEDNNPSPAWRGFRVIVAAYHPSQ